MHQTIFALAIIAIVSATIASAVRAQAGAVSNRGFTGSVGAAAGSATLSCPTCSVGQEVSPAVTVRLGHAAGANIVIAGEASAWRKRFSEALGRATVTLAFANLVLQWYPRPASGLFFKGGGGVSWMKSDIDFDSYGNAVAERTGVGGVIGAGWELPTGRLVSLTPYMDVNIGNERDTHGNFAGINRRFGGRLFQVGLALTWR